MLLRHVTKHVKDQNWFAVALDFAIVVVGVFIGIQVSNWNDAQQSEIRENAVLAQLEEEFSEIERTLASQIQYRDSYIQNIGALIATLEGGSPPADDKTIRQALSDATATGRRPAQSAAYLQLTTNGQLATLNNTKLERALIEYHTRLERDDFVYQGLVDVVIEEMSTNRFVDRSLVNNANFGATVDTTHTDGVGLIRSYDLTGLQEHENRYEAMYTFHGVILDSEQRQLGFAREILALIEAEKSE